MTPVDPKFPCHSARSEGICCGMAFSPFRNRIGKFLNGRWGKFPSASVLTPGKPPKDRTKVKKTRGGGIAAAAIFLQIMGMVLSFIYFVKLVSFLA